MAHFIDYPSLYNCGCYYQVANKRRYLPQVKLVSHTTILRTTAETKLEQTFSNNTKDSIKQCVYTFPLYDGVSVVDFDCHIGDRTLHGVVKERQKAKATYNAAIARGETAGLLEQLPQASDVFSTNLGNIPPGGSIIVKITYVGELSHDAEIDGIRWTLPTKIVPRYGPQPQATAYKDQAPGEDGISITVDVDVGQNSFIQSLQSPSHRIVVTMGKTTATSEDTPVMHRASATLALNTAQLDDDFVLIICNKDNGNPTAFLETHSSIPHQRAMMVDLVPKFSLPPARPEIIFVADRSGSMAGRITTLISALKVFLKSLPVGVKFNICSFGSRHTFLWPKSRAYNSDSLAEALSHIQTFGADYGGTETYGALEGAISNRFGDIDCEILLLTDGDIWKQNELFEYLSRTVGDTIRVFALGIGSGVSSALVEGVARAGKGFAQMVGNEEKLEKKIVRMLKGALSPHASYTLEIKYGTSADKDGDADMHSDSEWEMVEKVTDSLKVMTTEEEKPAKSQKPISLYDPSIQPGEDKAGDVTQNENQDPYQHLPHIKVPKLLQSPHEVPPLYPFTRTTVYLLLSPGTIQKDPKSVVLRGTSIHGPLELEIQVQNLVAPGKKIHQLAAKKAMQELEEDRGWLIKAEDSNGTLLKKRYPSRFDELVQREAVRLGEQFQVGGKWCSFVAVADNEERLACKGKKKKTGTSVASTSSRNLHASPPVSSDNPTVANAYRMSAQGYQPAAARSEAAAEPEDDDSDGDMGFGFFDEGPPVPVPSRPTVNARYGPTATPFSASTSNNGASLFGAPASSGGFGSGVSDGFSNFGGASSRSRNSRAGPAPLSRQPAGGGLFGNSSGNHLAATVSGGGGSPAIKTFGSVGVPGPILTPYSCMDRDEGASGSRPVGFGPQSLYSSSFTPTSQLPPKSDTASDKVHAIIDMQTFEGYWAYNQHLLDIMGLDKAKAVETLEMTLLIVVFLEGKMRDEKDVWELIVDKARSWLRTQGVPATRMTEMEAEARKIINEERN